MCACILEQMICLSLSMPVHERESCCSCAIHSDTHNLGTPTYRNSSYCVAPRLLAVIAFPCSDCQRIIGSSARNVPETWLRQERGADAVVSGRSEEAADMVKQRLNCNSVPNTTMRRLDPRPTTFTRSWVFSFLLQPPSANFRRSRSQVGNQPISSFLT
jgi:hypothetical protein